MGQQTAAVKVTRVVIMINALSEYTHSVWRLCLTKEDPGSEVMVFNHCKFWRTIFARISRRHLEQLSLQSAFTHCSFLDWWEHSCTEYWTLRAGSLSSWQKLLKILRQGTKTNLDQKLLKILRQGTGKTNLDQNGGGGDGGEEAAEAGRADYYHYSHYYFHH